MNIGLMIFVLVILAGLGGGLYLRRLGRRSAVGDADTGSVLMAFTNAFPNVAVRDVVQTEDGLNAFLRLADSRVGLVRTMDHNVVATILNPRDVRVQTAEHDRKLRLNTGSDALGNGEFSFGSEAETAEVSLWLVSGLLRR